MNWTPAETIANTVLYEGYLLYPYRLSSVKNRQRWNFGILYPEAFASAQNAGDLPAMRMECLVEGSLETKLGVKTRFLQKLASSVEEREIASGPIPLERILADADCSDFAFPPLEGTVEIWGEAVDRGLYRLRLRILNRTAFAGTLRDEALQGAFLSTHAILGLEEGRFVSAIDPPEPWRDHASRCANAGCWPILAGDPAKRNLLLASPIILSDYPSVPPESPGDFFDGAEIDEMLTLRILTLSDAEKEEMRRSDPRSRMLLERTEALTPDQRLALHGTMKPCTMTPALPRPGDRVRLRPKGRADIFDLALDGKAATVLSLEEDLEGRRYVAVTIDEDPGQDLGSLGRPGHRFFFRPEEVEPI